jgi:hypothetical protein
MELEILNFLLKLKKVPGTRLELAQVSSHAPQTCLSTNFSIRAISDAVFTAISKNVLQM